MARPPGRVVGEVWQDRVWNGFRSPLLATLSAVAALVCLAASLRALFQPWLLSLMGSAFICHFVACYCSTVAPRTPQQARSLRLWAAVSSLTGWFFRMQVYLMWYMEAPMSSMASSSYSNGSGNIAEVFTNGIEQVHALMLLPPSLVAPLLLVHMGLLYSALRSDGLQPPLLLSLIWSAAQVAMPRLLLAYLQRYAPPQTRASRTRERLPKHFMEYMGKLNDAAQSRPPPMACCSFDEAEAKRRVGCTVTHQPRRPCQGKSLDWPGSMLPPHAPSSTLTTPKVQAQGPLPAPAKDTTASSNPPAANELLALCLTDARLAADELGCGSATPLTPPAWALSDVSCSALNPQDSSKQAAAAGKQAKLWGQGGPVDRMAVLLLQQQAGQGSVAATLAAAEEAVAVESTVAGGVMGHGPLPPVSDGSVEAGHPVTEDVKGKEEEAKVEEERARVEEEEKAKAKVEVEEEKAVKAGTLVEDDRVVEEELSLLNLAFPVAGATPAEHDVDAAAMAEGQCFTGYLSTGSPVETCSAAASSSSLTDLVQQPHSSSWQAASQGGGGVDPLTMAKGAAAPGTQQAVAAAAAAGMASGVRVVVVRPGLPTPHASSSSYGSGAVRALPGGSSVPGHGRASAHANSLASMAVAPAWDLAPNQRTLQALANVQMLARKMSGAQGYKSRLLERQVIMKLGANEPGHLGASVLDTSTNMLSSDRSARWVAARASVRHGCVLLCIDLVACLPDPPPAASPSPLPTLDPSSAMSTSFAPSPGSLAPDGVLAEGSSSRTARWPSSETGSASNRLAIAPPPSLNSLSDAPQLLLEAPDCTSPSNARGGEEGRPAHRAGTGLSGGAGEEGAEDGEDVAQGHTEVAWPAAAGGGAMGLGPSTLRNSNLPIDSVQLEAWLDALLVAGRQQPVGTQVFIQVGSCQVLATFTGAHPAWLLHPLPPSTLNMTIEGATQVIWRLPGPRPAPAAPPARATTGPLSGPGVREDEEEEGGQAPSAAAPLAHLPVTLSLLLSHYGPVRFCGSDATSALPPLLPLSSGSGSQQAQAPGGGVAPAGPEAVRQQLLRAEELDRVEPGAGAEVRAVGERNVEAEGEELPREGEEEEEEVVVQVQARGSWGAGLPVMLLAASSAPGGEEGRWSTTLQLALPLALAPSPGNLFIELWHGPRRLTSLPLLLLPPRSDPHPPAPPPGSSSSGSSTTSTTMAPPSTPAQAPDLVTPSQDLDVANGSALLQLLLTSPPSVSPLSQGSQEGVAVADQGPVVDYELLELVVTAADLLPPGADLMHGLGSGADGAETAVEAAAGPGVEVEVEAAGGSQAVVGAGAGAAVVAVTEPPGGEGGSPDAPAALEPGAGAGGVREGSAAWLTDLGQLLHLAWYATHHAPGAKTAPRADTPLPPAPTNHVPAIPAALPPTPALVPAPASVPAPAAADPLRLDWGGVVSGMARAARSDTQLVSSTLHMAEGLLEYAVGCGLMHTAGLIAAAMEELRRGAGLEREEEGRPRSPGPGPMAPGARSAAVTGSEGAGEIKGEEEQGEREGAVMKGDGEHRGKHGWTLEVAAKRKGGEEEGMQGLGSKGGSPGAKDEFVFDIKGVQHTWAPSGTPAPLISALTSASQTAVTADPSASYSAGSCSNTSSSSSNSSSSSTTNCSSGSDATIPVSSSSSSSRGGSGVWDLHPLRGPPHVPSVKTSSPSQLERPSQGGAPLPPSPTTPCRAPAPLPATSPSASTSPTLSAPFACPPRPPARGQGNGSGCGSTHPAALLRAAVLGFSRPGQERAYSEWLGRRAAHTAQMWSVIYGMTVLCCGVRSVMHGTLAVELPMYVLVVLPYLMSWRLAARKQHRLYEASQIMHAVGRSLLFMAAGKGWLVWPSTFSVGYRVHVDVWGEVLMHTPAEHVRLPALLLSRLLLACSAWSMTLLHHMEATPMQQVYRVVTPLVGSLLVGALLDCQRRKLFLSLRGKPQAVR